MTTKRAAAVLTLLLATACGTTVPLSQQATSGNQPVGGTTGDGTGTSSGLGTGGSTSSTGLGGAGTTGSTTGLTAGTSTGGTTGSTGSGSATTGLGGSTSGSVRGGRTTAPLRVGVVVTDIGAAVQALGAQSNNSHAANDGYKAIIKALNLAGGLSGRRIDASYIVINALDNSYQNDAQTACTTMKDAKVELVISDAASTDYGFAACLWQAHLPMLSIVPSAASALAKAPYIFNGFAPTLDSGYGAVVDRLVASGYLTTKSKIGFVRISCPEMEAAYKSSVLPRMRAAHLATPIEYTVACAAGFQDAGAYSAAMQNAVLKFRSQGVDRVFVMGAQENLLLQYFAEQAQNQGYHPGYALSSGSLPVTLIDASTFPQQQLPQVHGVGWHPLSETGVDRRTAAESRCVTLSTKGGLKPANITEVFALYQACSNLFLLERVVKDGNGTADFAALSSVIPTFGSSFASTGIINGSTLYSSQRHNGPVLANEWAFTTSCTCFRYVGQPAAMR